MDTTSSDGTAPRQLPDLERLVAGLGSFLCHLARRVRQVAIVLATMAASVGVVALVLGVWAWHDSIPTLVLLALICGPAIAAPLFVVRRVSPLTEAVAHPDEAARQARSYFAGLQSTPELDRLVKEAAGMQRSGGKLRLRGAFRSARLLGSLVDSIAPDPRTQPLVAAFSPVRLRSIWLAVLVSWWMAVLASLFAVVAAVTILIDAVA